MNKKNWEQQIKWGVTAFAVLAAGTSVVFLILHLKDIRSALGMLARIMAPVIYGAVMAYLMAPVYNWVFRHVKEGLEEHVKGKRTARNVAKTVATLVSVVLLCCIAAGLISMVLPEIYRSVMNVVETLPQNVQSFYVWLQGMLEDPDMRATVLEAYNTVTIYAQEYVQNTLLPNLREIVGSVSVGIWNAVMRLKDVLIGVIVMIYLLNIKETLVGQSRKLVFAYFPQRWADAFVREFEYINHVFGGFIMGKLLDSLIIGILVFFILSLVKMPYTMLISVIVGVTNVIPFFGPFIGAIPSFILVLLVSPLQSVYLLLIILLVQQFDGNVLGPKILGDTTGISSFWVLFSILLFGGLFGFVGMIIAVPTWAVLLNLMRRLANRMLEQKQLPLASESYLNRDESKRL